MITKEQCLEEFGLTDKEIKVYLALLKLGSALVQEISSQAGTYRTYTYEILKSLIEKGLVSYVIKSGRQYFEVAEPEKLSSILKEKETKINEIMPELKEIYKSSGEKPKIELYTGKEGMKSVIDDLIKTKKEILIYGSTKRQIAIFDFYFPNYMARRIKEKIKIKVLTEKSKETIKSHKKDKKEFREMRFLPEWVDFPTAINIYGNKVAVLSLEKEPIGIILENEDFAKTQRIVFGLLWKQAKNFTNRKI